MFLRLPLKSVPTSGPSAGQTSTSSVDADEEGDPPSSDTTNDTDDTSDADDGSGANDDGDAGTDGDTTSGYDDSPGDGDDDDDDGNTGDYGTTTSEGDDDGAVDAGIDASDSGCKYLTARAA